MKDVYARTLRKAAEALGGIEALARHLGVATEDVYLWAQGSKPIPQAVFLKAVDLVVGRKL
jgi:hypothetical protein